MTNRKPGVFDPWRQEPEAPPPPPPQEQLDNPPDEPAPALHLHGNSGSISIIAKDTGEAVQHLVETLYAVNPSVLKRNGIRVGDAGKFALAYTLRAPPYEIFCEVFVQGEEGQRFAIDSMIYAMNDARQEDSHFAERCVRLGVSYAIH